MELYKYAISKELNALISRHLGYLRYQHTLDVYRYEVLYILLALRRLDAPLNQLQSLGKAQTLVRNT